MDEDDEEVAYHELLDDFIFPLRNDLEMDYNAYWRVCYEYREEELLLDLTGCLDSYV